jgi:hypothetical protein
MRCSITFRTQLVMNGITLALVALIVLASNTFASPGPATPAAAPASDAMPTTTISYQGHLLDQDGQPVTADLPMTFKLYPDQASTDAVWTEERSGAAAVPVTNGLFHVLLGSVEPITTTLLSQPLWLGISVDGDAEMQPREVLGNVPYAAHAGQAHSIASNSPVEGADLRFASTQAPYDQKDVALRQDGTRSLHLLPWGGPERRWDRVCIGCGGDADLRVHGDVIADNLVTHPDGSVQVRYGTAVDTTDSNCRINIRFDQPFRDKPYTIVASNGNANALSFVAEVVNWDKTTFNVRVTLTDGSNDCASKRVRVNYIAVGN